jgi:hypothetical protein
MFFALNKDGNRINAYEAEKNERYTCPICHHRVILKRGSVNIDHFAHESDLCKDNWNYDMSEWHIRMQEYFPKESREVVVRHKGKEHRADVLIGDIVIEFQYSPITAAEFDDRNEFFQNAGYRLAWVFNLSQIPEDSLYASDEKDNMMIWKHPMRIFANADYLGENNKRFALWFSFRGDCDLDDPEDEYLYMRRVVWAIKDEDGRYSMRRFFIFDRPIVFHVSERINPNHFFYSEKDFYEDRLAEFKKELSELKKKHPFSVKYKGKKGEPRQAYICPRYDDKFGIDMWGETGCQYCRYCYMAAQTVNEDGKRMYASYCRYPTQVRELCESHPGYECPQVDIYEIKSGQE